MYRCHHRIEAIVPWCNHFPKKILPNLSLNKAEIMMMTYFTLGMPMKILMSKALDKSKMPRHMLTTILLELNVISLDV